MRLPSLSKALLLLGALVGAAAGLALAFGLRLDQLPPWMITVGMYKLTFLAAAGLLAAGAMLGRAAKNRSGAEKANGTETTRPAVGAGPWEASRPAEADRIHRERGRD